MEIGSHQLVAGLGNRKNDLCMFIILVAYKYAKIPMDRIFIVDKTSNIKQGE